MPGVRANSYNGGDRHAAGPHFPFQEGTRLPNFIPTPPRSTAEIIAEQLAEEQERLANPPKKRQRPRSGKRKSTRRQSIDKLSPRMKDLEEGRISIEDLDIEELQRGQLRSADGRFHGPKPHHIPRAMHDLMQRELQKRMQLMFNGKLMVGFDAIVEIAQDTRAGVTRERLAAAQYIIERGIGKIAEKSEVKTEVTVFEHAVTTGGFLMDLGELEEGNGDAAQAGEMAQ